MAYRFEDLPYQHGQKVRAKKDSPISTWSKYVGTVIGYRLTDEGTFEYKVRAWRSNQHWWREEHLEIVNDDQLCIACRKLIEEPDTCNCGSHLCRCD